MDIVERLRIRIHTSADETALTNEAADEIERLREALLAIFDHECWSSDKSFIACVARDALWHHANAAKATGGE